MKIILLKSIGKLGKFGDSLSVRSGYARNYLFPKGFAVIANQRNIDMIKKEVEILQERMELNRIKLEKKANDIRSLKKIEIHARSRDSDRIFGSVGTLEICKKMKELGFDVHKNEVKIDNGPFRKVGSYKVKFMFHENITSEIDLHIVST
ncbi:50S ribosomal protein L9 [Candidatus Riesia pediculischaeffi]|uniref:Large ribosomal subunit protein bL9 n=2 Tax=Candidatus Riesia pediculischaeffi TaxID=428411 RepID=A0A1V0HKS7_9ENTR|nr:50S ribosomal protein L9 [Candidatus Riesia pediculischaeffi]ARC53342.1 hypothetical protein AOQ87_01490 [Candidatus Riesia pediculischaeffi]KIE63817.1 LSU ribosomal protein L9p [Candidatus Riesia pediculischaeffi PTSU]